MDFEKNVVSGKIRPSSDTKTHAFLYKQQGIGRDRPSGLPNPADQSTGSPVKVCPETETQGKQARKGGPLWALKVISH
jgi:hypothetical protein